METTDKICPACGKYNAGNATVCTHCGRLLEYEEKRKDNRPIILLISLIIITLTVVIGGYLFIEGQYSKAKEYYANGDYTSAANIFTKIPFYKDSKSIMESDDMEIELEYRNAISDYKEKSYLYACEWFVDHRDYSDSEDYIVLCVKGYLKGDWESDIAYLSFKNDGMYASYKDYGGIVLASSKPDYMITNYIAYRDTSTGYLVIKLSLYSDDEGDFDTYLENLWNAAFDFNSDHFVRA